MPTPQRLHTPVLLSGKYPGSGSGIQTTASTSSASTSLTTLILRSSSHGSRPRSRRLRRVMTLAPMNITHDCHTEDRNAGEGSTWQGRAYHIHGFGPLL